MYFAIKIDDKYFKEYVYATKYMSDRYTGPTSRNGTRIQEGDIIDIITTEAPERFEVSRSIGNTISTLVSIEKLKNKIIKIIPL